MTRRLYSLLLWLAQPMLRRKLRRRGAREPGYLEAVEERFGRYGSATAAASGVTVWLHAVSLGETRAAAVLIERLRERLPAMRLLLTHGTATGRAEGARLLRSGDCQSWQPWDTPQAVARFLAHFRPHIGILMETEVWPNLVAGCRQAGVPLVLANARMSDKSMRQASRLAWLSRPAFAGLSAVWAQTGADAARLTQLGARVDGVFGNLKFDATPNAAQWACGRDWRSAHGRLIVLLASSREGEEAALLQLLASLAPPAAAAVRWLIVPRHPQRFDAVAALIVAHGFMVSRRSSWRDGPPKPEEGGPPTVWLGDSLGEMALYYGLADVALLGGSFEPLGGQNLIEAAACACPLLMGPSTFNFSEAAELAEQAGAARRVTSLAQAVAVVRSLAGDEAARGEMARSAASFATAHRGAVEKTASAVLALLARQGGDVR